METVSFTQSTDEAVVENGLKFTECFKNYLDNLPPLLQRMVTRLKEIDAKTLRYCDEIEKLYCQLLADKPKDVPNGSKYKIIEKLKDLLAWCEQLGDEKILITDEVRETVAFRSKELEQKKDDFLSTYSPQWNEDLKRKREQTLDDAKKSKHSRPSYRPRAGTTERNTDKRKSLINSTSERQRDNNGNGGTNSPAPSNKSEKLTSANSSSSKNTLPHHSNGETTTPTATLHLPSASSNTSSSSYARGQRGGGGIGEEHTSSRKGSKQHNNNLHASSPASSHHTNTSVFSTPKQASSAAAAAAITAASTPSSLGRNGSVSSKTTPKSTGNSSSKLNTSSNSTSSSTQREPAPSLSKVASKRRSNKRRKKPVSDDVADDASDDVPIDPNEPVYCYCKSVSYGAMICCDNKTCEFEWFHFECVGLTAATKPKNNKEWYCPTCKKKQKK